VKRLLWFLIFMAGMLPMALLFIVKCITLDLLRVLWCVLYDEHIPDNDDWPLAWWRLFCRSRGGVGKEGT
jgi:hypothetical protein